MCDYAKKPEDAKKIGFAQLMVNLYHFFSTYELTPLQLFFSGIKIPSLQLSKTALLASFGSDGGHWRFFKENE